MLTHDHDRPQPRATPPTDSVVPRPRLTGTLLATVVVPVALVWALIAVAAPALAGPDAVLRGGALTGASAAGALVTVALAVLGIVVVLPWALLAGTAVVATQVCGSRPSVRAAWVWALRRPGLVVRAGGTLLATTLAAVVVVVVLAVIVTVLGLPAWTVPVLTVVGLLAACGRFADLTCSTTRRALLRDPRGGWSGVLPGLSTELPNPITPWELGVLVVTNAVVAVVSRSVPGTAGTIVDELGTGLVMVLVCRVVASSLHDMLPPRWVQAPEPPLPPARTRVPATAYLAAAVVSVLVMAAASPVALQLGPATRVRVVDLPVGASVEADTEVVDVEDGIVLTGLGYDRRESVECTPARCESRSDADRPYPTSWAPAPDGSRTWRAGWRPLDDAMSSTDVESDVVLALTLSEDAAGAATRVLAETPLPEELPSTGMSSLRHAAWRAALPVAVAVADDQVVVATVTGTEAAGGELVVHRCDDGGCRSASHPVPGRASSSVPSLAVGRDGTAYVAVGGTVLGTAGEGTRLYVDDGSGTVVERVVAAEAEYDTTRDDATSLSADVEVGPDGIVWVLHRRASVDDGRATLSRCTDAPCTTWEETAVPGRTIARGALTVDRSGRPLVVTASAGDGAARLWSCSDARCATSATVPLAVPADLREMWWSQATSTLHDDRPVVAVAGRWRGEILWCLDERCGAA